MLEMILDFIINIYQLLSFLLSKLNCHYLHKYLFLNVFH